MSKIGIIGLGLMGGSLAKSFKKVKSIKKILAYDIDISSLKAAKEEKIIDEYTSSIDENFYDLDFVFVCTPVNTIYGYVEKLKDYVNSNCVITDIGSTKGSIVRKIEKLGVNFVGGHPMIGSEKFGYSASYATLYANSYYILTKGKNTRRDSIEKLKRLLLKIDVIPIEIELENHDYYVAVISHVPHIIASALVHLASNLDDENKTIKTIAAGGFKDITRVASSNPDMWTNICKHNKEEILLVLDNFFKIINEFRDNIDNIDKVFEYFKEAKEYRDSVTTSNNMK